LGIIPVGTSNYLLTEHKRLNTYSSSINSTKAKVNRDSYSNDNDYQAALEEGYDHKSERHEDNHSSVNTKIDRIVERKEPNLAQTTKSRKAKQLVILSDDRGLGHGIEVGTTGWGIKKTSGDIDVYDSPKMKEQGFLGTVGRRDLAWCGTEKAIGHEAIGDVIEDVEQQLLNLKHIFETGTPLPNQISLDKAAAVVAGIKAFKDDDEDGMIAAAAKLLD